jgi:hypothetical protein
VTTKCLPSRPTRKTPTKTEIWFLPKSGEPKLLLSIAGTYRKSNVIASGKIRGITVERQTYDGVHSETKGTVPEFYIWDRDTKSLTLQKK